MRTSRRVLIGIVITLMTTLVAVPAWGSTARFTSATGAGGSGQDIGYAVAALPDGSSLVAGYFNGTATFGSITRTGASNLETGFVGKIGPDGQWVWVTQVGGPVTTATVVHDIVALPDGSAVVTGYFQGSADFGGGLVLVAAGTSDTFIAKISASGGWLWANRAGGAGVPSAGYAIDVLLDGSVIVAGDFQGTVTFGGTTLTGNADLDLFVAKASPTGEWERATAATSPSIVSARGISVAGDGSAVVTGLFEQTATFGGVALPSTGSRNAFVARIGADGSWSWATRAGGTQDVSGQAIGLVPDGGAIVSGLFAGVATFGGVELTSAGSIDAFVAKIGTDGTWVWATRAGGTGSDRGSGLAIAPDGSAIVTGDFSETATFGPHSVTSAGGWDLFVARVDAGGGWSWAIRGGGAGNDAGLGVAVMSNGVGAVAGYYDGAPQFGDTTLSPTGAEGVVQARFLWTPAAPEKVTWAVRNLMLEATFAGADAASYALRATRGTTTNSGTCTDADGTVTCRVKVTQGRWEAAVVAAVDPNVVLANRRIDAVRVPKVQRVKWSKATVKRPLVVRFTAPKSKARRVYTAEACLAGKTPRTVRANCQVRRRNVTCRLRLPRAGQWRVSLTARQGISYSAPTTKTIRVTRR
jgi:hypothetical protein